MGGGGKPEKAVPSLCFARVARIAVRATAATGDWLSGRRLVHTEKSLVRSSIARGSNGILIFRRDHVGPFR